MQVLEAETAGTKEQLERAIARAAAAEEEVAQMRAALADLHVRPLVLASSSAKRYVKSWQQPSAKLSMQSSYARLRDRQRDTIW